MCLHISTQEEDENVTEVNGADGDLWDPLPSRPVYPGFSLSLLPDSVSTSMLEGIGLDPLGAAEEEGRGSFAPSHIELWREIPNDSVPVESISPVRGKL